MIKNIYDYFQNLEQEKLPTSRGTLIEDGKKIVTPPRTPYENLLGKEIRLIEILKKPYYIKDNFGKMSMVDIASSKMYNDIGIPTPPVYMLDILSKPNIQTGTQDVNSVKGIEFTIAHSSIVENEVFSCNKEINNNKWDTLYDNYLKEELLQFMTDECFEQLITLHLIDELRTECDRHLGNYFFYKKPDSKKYEGVLPIDNEFARVVFDDIRTKKDFEYFLKSKYSSATIFCGRDKKSLQERMYNIKQVLHDGKLTQNQINIMKHALDYDLPANIKNLKTYSYLKPEKHLAYDGISRLWEYHHGQDGIEREL